MSMDVSRRQPDPKLLAWLLEGDVSIQFQTHRDLLGSHRPDLQARIALEGWGHRLLQHQNPDGSWGQRYYQPKWTSTHYTMLTLRRLAMASDTAQVREAIAQIPTTQRALDGGLGHRPGAAKSDMCINGMFLNFGSAFGLADPLEFLVDFILDRALADGGFNCRLNGPRHSSLHTTVSVLEGLQAFAMAGTGYRSDALATVTAGAQAFILQHRLFRSDRTGKVIHPGFLRMPIHPRWRYTTLRALDYFQASGVPYDERMSDALDALLQRRRKDGRWPHHAGAPGQTFFAMEALRQPSRWNTLIALRILRAYGHEGALPNG